VAIEEVLRLFFVPEATHRLLDRVDFREMTEALTDGRAEAALEHGHEVLSHVEGKGDASARGLLEPANERCRLPALPTATSGMRGRRTNPKANASWPNWRAYFAVGGMTTALIGCTFIPPG
jgi:hypothetical protein